MRRGTDVGDGTLLAGLGQFELRGDGVGSRLLASFRRNGLGLLDGRVELRVVVVLAELALFLQLVKAVLEGSGGPNNGDLGGCGFDVVGGIGSRSDPSHAAKNLRIFDLVGTRGAEPPVVMGHIGGDPQRADFLGLTHVCG